MERIEKILAKLLTVICSFFPIVMVLCTFAQVVRRSVFGSAFLWVEECAIWSMMWMMFLGSGLCIIYDKHAKIDFLVNKLPMKAAAAVRIIGYIACAVITMILTINALPVVKLNLANFSVGLRIPWAVYYSAFPTGGIVMTICFLFRIYHEIQNAFFDRKGGKTA